MDFIAIGDTVVDEFIRLKEARVDCDKNGENCTISLPWGDKIPYDFVVSIPGVGNAANAAVAAARLGLSSGFVSNIGKDRPGEEILASFAREGVDTSCIQINEGIPTNRHFVLWQGAERTILIRHEAYPYLIPENLTAPKWLYLSSMSKHAAAFHSELASWLAGHPETKLAFQPGTFQISMGKEKLAPLYARADFVACNKEEAKRILEISRPAEGAGETDMRELLEKMHALGPKIVFITDGVKGAYAYDGSTTFRVPVYPDAQPPVDRTGAGDASAATVVAALALGLPLGEALAWGPVNALSVVQYVGAQKGLLTREALEKLLSEAPAGYLVAPLE
ncbi:MAG: carbohydrate kinase family protein [Candidatus Paceibacterota bacterium]|jgi:sugar/nucleoside kinase (ribokinase family)